MALVNDEASSPTHRLKFLCRYGGRILPRPSDVQLRYVGGETRVLVVPRSISFADLKQRIDAMFGVEVVAKYQVAPEDLEVLVSVRSGEDLHHLIDEYDSHDSPTAAGSPRFRLYLFPSFSSLYHAGGVPDPISACTSPASTVDSAAAANLTAGCGGGGGGGMHHVRSTPNLSGSHNFVGSPRRYPQYAPTYSAHSTVGVAQLMAGCGCGCVMGFYLGPPSWGHVEESYAPVIWRRRCYSPEGVN